MKNGCEKRASEIDGVNCVYFSFASSNPRLQKKKLEQILINKTNKIDGLAFAVVHSKFSVKILNSEQFKNVPVITIDADFSSDELKKYPKIRSAYIGSNNYDLGYQLGLIYKNNIKTKDQYCIISGFNFSNNLNDRIKGFNHAIKDSPNLIENSRCPLYSNEDGQNSRKLGLFNLEKESINSETKSIIYMGGWPQDNINSYRKSFGKYQKDLKSKKINIYSIDSLPGQIKLLREGLSSGNVGQSPYEMGVKAIDTLLELHKGKKLKVTIIHTKSKICTPSDNTHC